MHFNTIFSSGMVFAKGLPIRIYGAGNGTAEIFFAGNKRCVKSENGKWYAEFPAMEYGGPYEITLKTTENQIVLNDIYVGEVYLFAGQSNMQFKVGEGKDEPTHCESNEMLRIYTTERIEKGEFFTPNDGWVKANKDTAKHCSALAHFAGIKLAKQKGIAIGIIVAYQGASVIESWVPKGIFEQNGIILPKEAKGQSHYSGPYSAWNHDGQLYEYTISKIIPFSLTGVVWYQGESDTTIGEAKVYGKELSILISAWRSAFDNSKLPFVIIQLADFKNADQEAWKMVQLAQYDIQFKVPNTITVISADACVNDDIHPPKNFELAERLADVIINMYV